MDGGGGMPDTQMLRTVKMDLPESRGRMVDVGPEKCKKTESQTKQNLPDFLRELVICINQQLSSR